MGESANSLVDDVVQFSTRSGSFGTTAALGYQREFSSISDLEVPSSASPSPPPSMTSSIISSDDDHSDKGEGILDPSKGNSTPGGFFSRNWFWGSSAKSASTKPSQYSTVGFDKESGLPLFTLQEVSMHDMPHDCWVVLYDRVYDITCFLNSHPGGDDVMLEYAGHDATIAFRGFGHTKEAEASLKAYLIGILAEGERIWTRFFNMKSDVP